MPKRIPIALLIVMAASPAVAESIFPIVVPGECYDLAQREGVPLVLANKYEAAKAKYKLARLRKGDPMVHECREAVARARTRAAQASK
jgi:hypothetical protein